MTQGNNNNTALDKYDNDSNDIFLLFKLKILNAIKFISNRKKCADLEAIFDYLSKTEASNADKELVENLLSQLVNYKVIINKKIHTGLYSFCLRTELQSEFWRADDEESQTENQNDVQEENRNEHGSSLILENSILPININTPNSSDTMNKSLLSQNNWKVESQVTALKGYVKCEISSINNKTESLFEHLNKMSSTEKKALEILLENISFLQKKWTSKDEIIKTFIETQTSILESVSYQKSKNELINQLKSAHQSPNKMNSSKSLSSPHLLNGRPTYHQDVNTNTSGANKNSCETNENIPEPENLQSQTRNKKEAFVGNLNNDLNIKDLKELFSLETTKYLKENCSITMPLNRKTVKNKDIVFALSPDIDHIELFKLNGIEFHGKSLILEEPMSSGKKMWTTTTKAVS